MNIVKVKLHGILGLSVGKDWNISVNSVGEAMRAIEILSKRKLFKFLSHNDKKGIKYKVLINGRNFESEEELDIKKPSTILNSELAMNFKNLETIDIVPILEGSNASIGSIILGVVLIVVGIVLIIGSAGAGSPLGAALIIGGLGLIGAGVINLLTSPPKFDDFRQIANSGGKVSYLFNGPENVTREGGPVPVGYGRLLVGSHVISASYDIKTQDANLGTLTV